MMSPLIQFKDWLPDQPDFGNPGVTEALNVLPVGQAYQPYLPLSTPALTTAAFSSGFPLSHVALQASKGDGSTPYVYVGTADGHVYQTVASGSSWTDLHGAVTWNGVSSLLQYDDLIIVAVGGQSLFSQTVGSATTFGAIANSPHATVVGSVNQFLVAGNMAGLAFASSRHLQWSAIADPTNWPTPGSDTANATQAGEQFLLLENGGITGIYGGDQWGIVTQQNALTRMTYIGPPAVFQFDTLAAGIGMDFLHGGVKIGGLLYFLSSRGVYTTDGTSINPIGEEKVNRWFVTNIVNAGILSQARAAVDWTQKLIYWSFAVGGASPVLIFNFETGRFTHATDVNVGAMVAANVGSFASLGLQAVGQDNKLGTFTGTAGTATLISAEAEINPGQYTLIDGIKPVATGSPSMSVLLGTRNDQGTTASFSSTTTALARTGVANFRNVNAARYHRAKVLLSGSFTQMLGIQQDSTPTGAV